MKNDDSAMVALDITLDNNIIKYDNVTHLAIINELTKTNKT